MKRKKLPVAVQSNSLVSARYKLSLGEQRIILMMISKITPNDKDFQGYELPVTEMAKLFDMDEKSVHREIVLIASRLLKRPLRIKQVDGSLLLCNWIAEAVYKTGILTVKPAPSLKPYLLELKEKFTIIPLEQAGRFRSIYSIRIYQLVKQYYGLGCFETEVAEFRAMLNLEKRYLKFYELRRWVLDVAKKELDEKSDISFILDTVRKGKTINTLKFIIIKNNKKENEESNSIINKSVKQLSLPSVKPPPQPQYYEFPEYWFEFLEHLKKHDPGLLPIIETEGPNIGIVKYPYLHWKEKFKG